jgi:hypothetical protein
MEKGVVKLVVFNGEYFGYWKNQTRNYLLSQGRTIWAIVQEAYVILDTLDHATQGELQKYENNYMALNLITSALGRNVHDRVAHLETAHDVWLKLCNTYEGSYEIKSSRRETYNRQYQTFSQKPGESLDDCFARFELIVSSLRSCGPLAYSDNERAKQLFDALDDSVWGTKITALEESVDFANLDTEKLFSKLKSHELSRKGHLNHDASLTSKAFVTSTRVGGHVANPTNTTDSYVLEFALSSLCAASDEHPRWWDHPAGKEIPCCKCCDTTHFIANCPKRKKLDTSSNKYDCTKWNDYNKGDDKKKYRSRDKKKKKFRKMLSRACVTLSDIDFSSDDSSSSEVDERPKLKIGDFTDLCLMGKSSWHISDSDSDVMGRGLEDTWLMDSGCSRHMTRNKKWFSSLTPLSHNEYVTFRDDKKGKVLGTDIIKVNDCYTLNDVAPMDRLRYNLLSVSQLCDADLSVLFHKFHSHVLDSSGKRVCGISHIGNIF